MRLWRNVVAGVMATLAASAACAQTQDLVPMVTYDQSHPLVEENNLLPMVRVYATGEVIIYRGAGNRNPGLYELQLSDDELSDIKRLAQEAGVAQFDEAALVDSQSASADGMLTYSSDPTTSTFEFNRVQGASNLSTGDGSTSDELQTVMLEDVSTTTITNTVLLGPLEELHERLIELFTAAGR